MRNGWLVVLVVLSACRVFEDHLAPGEIAAVPGTPRLIAPGSLSAVTQQRPALRWVGTEDAAPVVELCADCACATPIAVATQLAADGLSAVPTTALPHGWVFWRVHATAEGAPVTSATWQFWVGAASASSAVDSTTGAILDVNGDGFADVLVGGDGDTTGKPVGGAHLFLGAGQLTAASWDATSTASRIDLMMSSEVSFGSNVASAGDVDGDGFADFLLGSSGTGDGVQIVHVLLGSATPSAADWLAASSPRRIDVISPTSDGFFGVAMAAAGDLDGDGYADFVIGAAGVNGLAGAAYVYYGSAHPTAVAWTGATAADRVDLVNPSGKLDDFGTAVAGLGDVNGDGYADLAIGAAPASSAPGSAYVYLGGAARDPAAWIGAAPARRITVVGPDAAITQFGTSIAGAGDVNNDGYADFLIGTIETAYLYLGSAAPGLASWVGAAPAGRIDLISPTAGDNFFGSEVIGAGDVNGDGFSDFAIGSSGFQVSTGAADFYLGAANPSGALWNGGAATRRIHLTTPDGQDNVYAWALGGGGDVDGDRNADFLVSSLYASTVHVYRGAATPAAATWNGGSAAQRLDLVGPTGTLPGFGASLGFAATCGARCF